ncbi:MAG: hypothetical protein AB7W16_01855, partial [Candidatus Obscuribacterales bacterium]
TCTDTEACSLLQLMCRNRSPGRRTELSSFQLQNSRAFMSPATIANFQNSDASDLEELDFGERVITCRLGGFLGQLIEPDEQFSSSRIKVDCEYNRNLAAPKRVGSQSQENVRKLLVQVGAQLTSTAKVPLLELTSRAEEVCEKGMSTQLYRLEQFVQCVAAWGDLAGTLLYPDIIVHKRGSHEFNLLVIEAKKHDADQCDVDHDFAKLCYYTSPELSAEQETKAGLNYKYGLFLHFAKNAGLADAVIFEGGQRTGSAMEHFKTSGLMLA